MYVDHDVEEQKRVFIRRGMSLEADAVAQRNGKHISKWVFPLGFVRWKPKFCESRSTLAAVILDYMGLYCESSWGLGWGHIYITIIMSISVTIAMYCLIQLYVTVSSELAEHKPLLKLFSVKAVVFLTFWQATFLSLLSMFGVIKNTKYMTADDVNIGIAAVLETFEMMLFAFLHIKAFSYKPYKYPRLDVFDEFATPQKTPPWRSLAHAMDFRETFREIWIGIVYMFYKLRGREPITDLKVKREGHYSGAFGMQRPLPGDGKSVSRQLEHRPKLNTATLPSVQIEVDKAVEVEGERQWLMLEDFDRRGLHPKREKSDSLQEQIDRELERLRCQDTDKHSIQNPIINRVRHQGGQRSWWRNVYYRISQSSPDGDDAEKEPLQQRRQLSPRRLRTFGDAELKDELCNLDDQPPQSVLYPLQSHWPRTVNKEAQFEATGNGRGEQSIDENYKVLHQNHNPETRLLINSPAPSPYRASRSSPDASHLPSSKLQTPINGVPRPLTYDDPYLFNVPIRYPIDPNEGNHPPPSARKQNGPSSRPFGNTLTMPVPLDPQSPLHCKNARYSLSSSSVLTSFNSNPGVSGYAQRKVNFDNPRSSIHRREPAGESQDNVTWHQKHTNPAYSRIRFSRIPSIHSATQTSNAIIFPRTERP
ncbi:Transmembrane protein 184-like protein [Psilocybe cubensis]|nr:Transmembrane protein 184-like protein [Psilocybe cubensis]KAH9485156.1 Transmembrane protein 184-like protein [Psilocybe cubensis]